MPISQASPNLPVTRWSLVVDARAVDAGTRRAALEAFCRTYWQPLYCFARRRGLSSHDAEDVTQGFLAHLLESQSLESIHTDPSHGRLRSYLLMALTNFMTKQWERQRAEKRGGRTTIVSLNADEAEGIYITEPADEESPAVIYERRWAMSVMRNALDKLRDEYERSGKSLLFDAMKGTLALEGPQLSFADIAASTGMSEGAARVAAHRLRQHLRVILEEEVASTVADRADTQDEMRHLMKLLASR